MQQTPVKHTSIDASICCWEVRPGFPHRMYSLSCDTIYLLLIMYVHNGHLLVLKLKLQEGGHLLFNVEAMDRRPPFGTGSFKHLGRTNYQPSAHWHSSFQNDCPSGAGEELARAQWEDFLHGWGMKKGGSHWYVCNVTFDHQKASRSSGLSSQSLTYDFFSSHVRET